VVDLRHLGEAHLQLLGRGEKHMGLPAVITSSNNASAKLLVSAVIVGILSIQAVAGFVDNRPLGLAVAGLPHVREGTL
jgi:hypothetical protein